MNTFEKEYGPVSSFKDRLSDLADAVCAFAADGVLDGAHSRPRIAVAAVARQARLVLRVNVYDDPRVKAFLKGVERYAAAVRPPAITRKRDPLPIDALCRFATNPPPGLDAWEHALIVAVLAVGIRCIRRPGEMVDLREYQLRASGACTAAIWWRFLKNNLTGNGLDVPFEAGVTAACPIRALDRYLRIAKGCALAAWSRPNSQAHLFVHQDGRPLASDEVKNFVRLVASAAGLQGVFGGHSIRITGACRAIAGGMTLEQTMAIGGWSSRAMETYLRSAVAAEQRASSRMGL